MMFAFSLSRTSHLSSARPLGLTLALALGLFGSIACKGSVNAEAKASSDSGVDGEANFDAEGQSDTAWEMTDDSQSEAQTSQTAQPSSPQTASTAGATAAEPAALLGARHDLLLAEGSKENCKCLAAVLGPANAPAFVWTGRRPTVDQSAQLVIALASEGINCSEAKAGASYQGYELLNGDVIVRVETAVPGRPVTHGAIIPRPDAAHQVYIQPSQGGVHGKSLSGEARCALGNGS